MIEHAFYQGLNLLQILLFHALHHPAVQTLYARTAAVLIVTAPWLLRHHFPVNHFSANYRTAANPWSTVSILYGSLYFFLSLCRANAYVRFELLFVFVIVVYFGEYIFFLCIVV
jgi:hypothetical protein